MASDTNMHRKDFKPCAICHKGVMHTGLPLFWRVHIEHTGLPLFWRVHIEHTGLPLFWRVHIERIGVDMQAAQRQHGLEQFFGGTSHGAVALADMFSDGAPIGLPLDEGKTVLVCEDCAMADMPIAVLAERGE